MRGRVGVEACLSPRCCAVSLSRTCNPSRFARVWERARTAGSFHGGLTTDGERYPVAVTIEVYHRGTTPWPPDARPPSVRAPSS